ncbi:hypothetical protein EI77_02243 [Prosthecobacter fusiformis]|uniref:Uncharacterized protein n=1 Tax=Prosthecobacter fusiformis TaxID=48464 RepID=A0A4R7RYV2_9BACT|nr:choice-of-anchor Q domain-containing protein [Prosthecobacter fusiformis]TDU71124.1 hypothetical protein EI77_02243 [Prosthecobacter fusiformis]
MAEYKKGTPANLATGLTPDIIVPDDFPTIAAAVASLTEEDSIILVRAKPNLAPYVECVDNTGLDAKRIFIIAEETDAFKTVIQLPADDANDFVIASSRDLYLSGFRVIASGEGLAPRTAIKLVGDGVHAVVLCVTQGGLHGVHSIANTQSKLDVVGCLLQDGLTAGIQMNNQHEARVAFSTIAGFTAAGGEGTGVGIKTLGTDGNSSISVTNSILWNAGIESEVHDTPDDDQIASVSIKYSDVRGIEVPYPNVNHNQDDTPGLIQGMLAYGSACIDAASIADSDPPALTNDIRGRARVVGSNADVGAHEFNAEAVEEDLDGDGVPDSHELYVTRSLFYKVDSDGDETNDGTDAAPINDSVTQLEIVITKPVAN